MIWDEFSTHFLLFVCRVSVNFSSMGVVLMDPVIFVLDLLIRILLHVVELLDRRFAVLAVSALASGSLASTAAKVELQPASAVAVAVVEALSSLA